jgi:hypothetical protein
MTHRIGIAFAAALALSGMLSGTLAAQGAGPRRDGNWQVTIEMEMPGMPQRMPPSTVTQCLTKADVADPMKSMPQSQGRGAMPKSCKVTDYKTVGNTVTWSMACEGENAMTAVSEFVYTNDTYVGTMKMNMQRGGQTSVMSMKYSGKRLGDCP